MPRRADVLGMVKQMSQAETAERRSKAVTLFEAGFSQAEVARRCKVSRQTAMRWKRAFDAHGATGLAPKRRGRPRRLSDEQCEQLQAALLQGPASHGWSTDLWTLERVAQLTRRLFGVRYHTSHIWKLMRSMGWSLQRPTTRAKERDEAAIASWKTFEWRRLKKTGARRRRSFSSTKAGSAKAR